MLGKWEDAPDSPCPFCQKRLDRTFVINDTGVQEPGAWTVCSHCGAVLRFTSGMTLRMATAEEMRGLGRERMSALYNFRNELMLAKAARN